MTKGYELLKQVFGEEFDLDYLYEVRDGDLLRFEVISDELSYNSGWYNYYKLIFKDAKTDKKYSIEYNKHTSDNVCDGGFLLESFEEIEDKSYEAFSKLMDSVFDLAHQLSGNHPDDLTENELNFLKAMDAYCEIVEEEE